MSRTRSGKLDTFDLTGISDSEDNENDGKSATMVLRKRRRTSRTCPRPLEGSGLKASCNRGESRTAAGATITPIQRSTHAIFSENDGTKNHKRKGPSFATNSPKDGIPSICRRIIPSVSPQPDERDAIEITGESNPGANPFVDFPHRREDCQRFDFGQFPENFCRLCYCYICDVPASECQEWFVSSSSERSHCLARHSDKQSRLKRRSVQIRKNTLRPRRRLLPPHRLRPIPERPSSGANNSQQRTVETALLPRTHVPSTLSLTSPAVSRTNQTVKRVPSSSPKSLPPPSLAPPMSRSLRPRNNIELPHRLRPASGMLSSVTSKQPTEETRSSPGMLSSLSRKQPRMEPKRPPIISPPPPPLPNLQHDLFLPGKKRQPTLPLAPVKVARKTKRTNRTKRTHCKQNRKSLESRTKTETTRVCAKRKRCSKSPLQDSKITAGKKTPTAPLRSSSHFTRSCGKANLAKAPEIYGTLGAYWRGEPTKYAGVPYQKRSISSRIRAKPALKNEENPLSTPPSLVTNGNCVAPMERKKPARKNCNKIGRREVLLPSTSTCNTVAKSNGKCITPIKCKEPKRENYSRIGTRRVILPSTSTCNAEANGVPTKLITATRKRKSFSLNSKGDLKKPKRAKIQRRRTSFPLTPTCNSSNKPPSEESRMSKVATKKAGEGLAPTGETPMKQTLTATLKGKISYDAESRKYSMLGTWHCPWSKSFPPQKFGLVRNLRDGEKGPTAAESSLDGNFDGYCVVSTRSLDTKGEPSYHDRLVFESDVLLEFKSSPSRRGNTKTKPLEVNGSGSNKFGAFLIDGKAQPCSKNNRINCTDLYTFVLKKRYLSNFPTPESSRSTRSKSIHENGTIVRKLSQNGEYREGEVIGYDRADKRYKIRYTGGELEDFDEADMKKYYKHHQKYSHERYPPQYLRKKTRISGCR